jgi:uncharacterized protein
MAHYFCRLNAPRSSFLRDMSEAERQIMQEHGAYWRRSMEQGHVIAFGLVADPAAPFGVGIVDFATDADVHAFTDNDPAVLSGRGFSMDVHPMPLGAVHP